MPVRGVIRQSMAHLLCDAAFCDTLAADGSLDRIAEAAAQWAIAPKQSCRADLVCRSVEPMSCAMSVGQCRVARPAALGTRSFACSIAARMRATKFGAERNFSGSFLLRTLRVDFADAPRGCFSRVVRFVCARLVEHTGRKLFFALQSGRLLQSQADPQDVVIARRRRLRASS